MDWQQATHKLEARHANPQNSAAEKNMLLSLRTNSHGMYKRFGCWQDVARQWIVGVFFVFAKGDCGGDGSRPCISHRRCSGTTSV